MNYRFQVQGYRNHFYYSSQTSHRREINKRPVKKQLLIKTRKQTI